MSIEDLLKQVLGGAAGADPKKRASQLPPLSRPLPRTPEREVGRLHDTMHGVVQVVALAQNGYSRWSSAWTGSGTVVDPSGYILTNCHVVKPSAMGMRDKHADRLGIAITERSDAPPALTYLAEIAALSPELDLAVLRIVSDTRGRRVRRLDLDHLPLGDSDELNLGDRLNILGYPGIGGETVTYTAGNVSGFSGERGLNVQRAWIKTDATIAGGNSGGSAVDDSGLLVGVPTQAAAGRGILPVDARPVLDTNRDGRVDSRDNPMAVGGFINGLRPVNLAIPLLREAGAQVDIQRRAAPRARPQARAPRSWQDHTYDPTPPATAPRFSDLVFSTAVTDDARPIQPADVLPVGTEEIHATFHFEGMKPGTPWGLEWSSGGNILVNQKKAWDDPESGSKSVKIRNRNGVPAGEYRVRLLIDGRVTLEDTVTVGTPVDERDSEISGRITDDSGRPLADAVVVALKPGQSTRRFLESDDSSMVYSHTRTKNDGTFTLPEQLMKNQAYSLVVAARGYEVFAVESALRLSRSTPEHATIQDITMKRR